jgi:hypothetical protein
MACPPFPASRRCGSTTAGERIGPEPLVTGFDTHWLCQRVAAQEKPWTWHLLNWRIAAKEFAISGAEHNQRIRDRQFPLFLKETLLGNHRLVKQMAAESPHFLVDDTLAGLAAKMNALAGTDDVSARGAAGHGRCLRRQFRTAAKLHNDDQIRRILHARQWGPDKLRTCKPAPLQQPGAGPFIAIQMQLITRKSLGGLQTDLHSRVLDASGQPHARPVLRGRGGRLRRRRRQRQALAGRHLSARLHSHGARGGPLHPLGPRPLRVMAPGRTVSFQQKYQETPMSNGAQALMKTLADAGIEVCFTNPGTSEMHFVAALDSEPRCAPCWPCSKAWPPVRPMATPAWPTSPPPRSCTWAAAWATAWPTCTTPARARCRWSTSWVTTPPTTPSTTPSCSPTSRPWRATCRPASCAPPNHRRAQPGRGRRHRRRRAACRARWPR